MDYTTIPEEPESEDNKMFLNKQEYLMYPFRGGVS